MDGPWQLITIVWLLLVVSLSATAVKTQIAGERRNLATQNQSFISIDCGVNGDYLDETTGLYYRTDRDFIDTGDNGDVLQQFNDADDYFARLYRNLRYFPEGRKNCYTLKPEQGKNNNYLIVAYFKYGNYDGMNRGPNFDLYLGVSYWATIQFSDQGYYYPAYHFSPSDSISLCLLNTGSGVPFISALELRPVNSSIYRTDSGFATVERRCNVGNSNNTRARYKDDAYDRIWEGCMLDDWVLLNTTQNLDIQTTNDSYKLPSEVLRTAVQPRDNNSLSFSISPPYSPPSFNAYFHFAELQMIPEGQKREFTITLNGNQSGPFTPQYLKPLTVVYEKAVVSEGVIQFSIKPTAQSDLPPILNGFEILLDKSTNASETSPVDVGAITAIKRIYNLDKPGWQGDPCMPKAFPWDGLKCSDVNSATARITSLNLSSSKLSGVIALEFSNLQELQSLDLSNNQLNGTAPEFLAQLPNLVILNLSGNQLADSLPQSLIEKSRNGTLNLSFDDGKSNSTVSCDKKKRNIVIPILIAIISLLVLSNLIILAMYWRMKRHGVLGSRSTSLLISKNRSFTYSEIVNMTDNFENIIGEGGFGKVYHGELNDGTQIAVKLLSESSKQGFKEFLSEVQLLIMVYHRNLVSLIGYYEDHGNMALVYEFMENGNLRELLSDKTSYVLNWRERLQIALDSAQGLEYLHNGCKPPIVHRDLKTSNILLNENLVAKISDFGLSRVFANDKDTHVSTYPAGTFGYADPEVYVTGNLTKKSDIYSFGIILFELITGQPVVIKASEDQSIHILQWVTPMIESGDIQSIIDKRLDGEFNTNSAWKIVEIAMSCVPKTAVERPDMSQVLTELKECLAMDMASGGSRTMRSASSKTISRNALEMSFIDVDTHVNPSVR